METQEMQTITMKLWVTPKEEDTTPDGIANTLEGGLPQALENFPMATIQKVEVTSITPTTAQEMEEEGLTDE